VTTLLHEGIVVSAPGSGKKEDMSPRSKQRARR
jgi:hypothetical protein